VYNIQTLLTEEEVFSLEDIDFGVKRLAKKKVEDIEDYQVEIIKFGGSILIHYIHNIFNFAVKQDFSKP